ncbi:MAG: hypothetical protein K0U68_04425 [Gammaproteobacteria bacterium]|nr:hypothetical protein [Gammaproteobacteria bacterium]
MSHQPCSVFYLLFIALSALLSGSQLHAADPIDISFERGELFLTPNHGGDGSAWGLEECAICHVRSQIHKDVAAIRGIVRRKGYDTCTACHGSNGTDKPRYCTTCHNNEDLPDKPHLIGAHNHNFIVGTDSELGDAQCITCHQSSDMDGEMEVDVDYTLFPDANNELAPYQEQADFCLRCHNRDHQQAGYTINTREYRHPLIAMEDNFNHIDFHGKVKGSGQRTYAGLRESGYDYGQTVQCEDCHALHGTTNPKLIINSSLIGARKLKPQFRDQDYPVHIEYGNYSELCVLCHQMTEIVEQGDMPTGNGLSGVHDVTSDCRTCHRHGLATQTGL